MDLNLSGQLVTDGAGNNANLDFSGLNVDLAGRMLRLSLTVDVPDRLNVISFYLGIGGLTNSIRWWFGVENAAATWAKPGEATTITLSLAEVFSAAGTISLSTRGVPSALSGFTHARLQADDDGTVAATITLHSVEVVDPVLPGAYVSITFDDSHESIDTYGYPKLAEYGFAGTDYTIVESLGTTGHTTLAGLQRRAADGWEIAGHSYDPSVHAATYTGVDEATATADLAALRTWIETVFPHPFGHTMAYPQGRFGSTTDGANVEQLVVAAGFVAARTTLELPGSTAIQMETLPPPQPARLYGLSGISSLVAGQADPSVLLGPGGALDKVEANGGWLIMAFHVVVDGTPTQSTEIAKADFDAIIESLAARNVTVLPVRDVLQRLAKPATAAAVVGTSQTVDETAYTSQVFTVGTNPCGIAFVAPPSGQVLVLWSARTQSDTRDVRSLVSIRVGTGPTIGEGDTVAAASDSWAVESSSDTDGGIASRIQAGMSRPVRGLKPGQVYHAHTMHRLSNAGIGEVYDRAVTVIPLQ